MAIAFKGAGTGHAIATSARDTAPTCPATVDANDILIAHVLYGDNVTGVHDPGRLDAARWSVPDQTSRATAEAGFTASSPRAPRTARRSTSFRLSSNTGRRLGRIYSYSGYVSGTIRDVVPVASIGGIGQAATTAPAGPTVKTTHSGSLAMRDLLDDNAGPLARSPARPEGPGPSRSRSTSTRPYGARPRPGSRARYPDEQSRHDLRRHGHGESSAPRPARSASRSGRSLSATASRPVPDRLRARLRR